VPPFDKLVLTISYIVRS
jgi:hypothetical protein